MTGSGTQAAARPSRPVAMVEHSAMGDLTISIEGVGTAVATSYSDLPAAVEQLRPKITASYDHDEVTIVFPAGDDAIGRHGNQHFVAAAHWPAPSVGRQPEPADLRFTEQDREVLVTTHDDGEVGVHVVRRYGDGRGHQVIRLDPGQGGWVASLLGIHPEARVELTNRGLRMVDSADWRGSILGRLARCWDAHSDMRLGSLILDALRFASDDNAQYAVSSVDLDLLDDIDDDALAVALDRFVSVDSPLGRDGQE